MAENGEPVLVTVGTISCQVQVLLRVRRVPLSTELSGRKGVSLLMSPPLMSSSKNCRVVSIVINVVCLLVSSFEINR